jgi:STE24 endopeptidase
MFQGTEKANARALLSRRLRLGIFAGCLIAALAAVAPVPANASATPAAILLQQQPPATQKPAPVPAQAQVAQPSQPVTEYTLPPDKYREAVGKARAQHWLYFGGFVYGLVVLLLVLGWRLPARYRDWAEHATKRRIGQAAIFVPLLLLTLAVLGLPLDAAGQWVSLHYHQSVQGWGSWFWDWTKAQLVSYVVMIFLIWILYGVIRRSPRRWWFYFWIPAMAVVIFIMFISPYVLEPMFNKFEPLQKTDPALVTELEQVTVRAGAPIPPSRMFLMEASRKVNSLNAYVSGFGASKRVVVWDTTIKKMTTPEIAFVFGHEMGHYVLNHILWGLLLIGVSLLVLLWLGYQMFGWSLRRWGGRWAIRGVEDWASFPVLLLWLSIFSFVASPIFNGFSRHFEHEADRYGLEVTHGMVANSPQNAARAFQILGEVNLAEPHPSPFIVFWLYNHPPISERVQFSLHYNPWANGQHPRYVRAR